MCMWKLATGRHNDQHQSDGGGTMYVDARFYKVMRYALYATLSLLLSAPFIAVGVLLVIDIWNVGSVV